MKMAVKRLGEFAEWMEPGAGHAAYLYRRMEMRRQHEEAVRGGFVFARDVRVRREGPRLVSRCTLYHDPDGPPSQPARRYPLYLCDRGRLHPIRERCLCPPPPP